jgi:capsular polysaccharide transport system permease protein
MTGKAVHSIRNSGSLLFHHNIRILDVMIARAVLETLGILAAFFIAWVPLVLLGAIGPMTDPLLFVAGFALHAWFCFSIGCIIAALSEMWQPTEQFVPPVLYLTLPVTGAFSLAAWLPQSWREMLMWSPLANTQEMVRAGTFPPDTITYYYPTYVFLCCLVLTAIALPLVHYAQKQTSFS